MKRQLPIALVLLALACTPVFASNGEIAIVAPTAQFGDGDNPKNCDYWVVKHRGNTQGNGFGSCVVPSVLRIYAVLEGASAGGITGAEYSANLGPDADADAGWTLTEFTNSTATTIVGSAFVPPDPAPRGINISWATCQSGDGSRVLLANVVLENTAGCGPSIMPPSLDFQGAGHSAPSNQFFRCPLFTLCDGPVFTKVCLGTNIVPCQTLVPPFPIASKCSTSGSFRINPPQPGKCVSVKADGGVANSIANDTWSNVKSLYQ